MLKITIPAKEMFNERTNEFVTIPETQLSLEHSLVSLSKWESKWHKPFLSTEQKTPEETMDYIRCMTLTQNVKPVVYMGITDEIVKKIRAYIDDPMTATWFSNRNRKGHGGEQITAELIYYWMIALNIPFECQKWHLNKLLTLVEVCSIKNEPEKKMSKGDIYRQNAALNKARQAKKR